MSLTDSVQWHFGSNNGLDAVFLRGSLTEHADLSPLAAQLQDHARIRLVLGEIAQINSAGVREWSRFLQALNPSTPIELWECSPCFVAQMNMIENFVGGASVRSVRAPYYCEQCHLERTISHELRGSEALQDLTEPTCTADGAIMVLDDLPELYFRFLQR